MSELLGETAKASWLTGIPNVPLVEADRRPIVGPPLDASEINHRHGHVDRFLGRCWSHHVLRVGIALGVQVERVVVDNIDDLIQDDSIPVVVALLAAGDELRRIGESAGVD